MKTQKPDSYEGLGGIDVTSLGIVLRRTFHDHAVADILRAVNCHEELLEAAKNARNVLAGLVMGDLKEVRANSPALQSLRNAIAKAEGK